MITRKHLVAVGLLFAGCFDPPKPDCGFPCDANTGCPDGYTCAGDRTCHRNGAAPTLYCATVDAGGYSPRLLGSYPMAGQTIPRMENLAVRFDIDVIGVDETSFSVVLRSTQTRLPGIIEYLPVFMAATWKLPGGLPANEQFDMILTGAIRDPLTMQPLVPQTIAFATAED